MHCPAPHDISQYLYHLITETILIVHTTVFLRRNFIHTGNMRAYVLILYLHVWLAGPLTVKLLTVGPWLRFGNHV